MFPSLLALASLSFAKILSITLVSECGSSMQIKFQKVTEITSIPFLQCVLSLVGMNSNLSMFLALAREAQLVSVIL